MEIKQIPVKQLQPAKYNPRFFDEEDKSQVKLSLEKFGFVEPLVVNIDNTVIGGHLRLQCAIEMEIETVPCFVMELTKADEKLLNVALNGLGGQFDSVKLANLLQEIRDMPNPEISGFNTDEIRQRVEANYGDFITSLNETRNVGVLSRPNISASAGTTTAITLTFADETQRQFVQGVLRQVQMAHELETMADAVAHLCEIYNG